MIAIFRGTYSETMNVKNLLENLNIQVFIENETMANIEPWTISSGGFSPVILKIRESDLEKAKKIVQEFESGNLNIEV